MGPEDLSRARCVSKQWHETGSSKGLWRPLCTSLWEGKVYVPAPAKELLASGHADKAYAYSLLDARREALTVEELTSFTW